MGSRRVERSESLGSCDSVARCFSPVTGRPIRRRLSSRSSSEVNLSTESQWAKDSTGDACPIMDPRLRRKLRRSDSVNAYIKLRDQKILGAMMTKKEMEEKQREYQADSERAWSEEKRHQASTKKEIENQRRRSMIEDRQMKEMRRLEMLHKKKLKDATSKEDVREHTDSAMTEWEIRAQRQKEMREKRIQERKQKELERKKSVEEAKKLQEQEWEEFRKLIVQKQEFDLKRANSKRQAKEFEGSVRTKQRNRQSFRKVRDRQSRIQEEKKEELQELRASIAVRHSFAASKHADYVDRRNEDIDCIKKEREQKMLKSKAAQKEMEAEMKAYYEDLKAFRQLAEERAEEVAKLTIAQRKKRAQQMRELKDRLSQHNLEKIKQEEEAYQDDMKNWIALKDEKSDKIIKEKKHSVEESRAMASASKRLREEIRQQFTSNEFTELENQARLQSRMGSGVERATKNMSTLTLG